ncbi:MAG: hypothetical protein QNJ46_09600 [Leptolyngbyaceae cyanobacterium MO_188.B28]|nr:hypothetical protein [Leptolyngbyaceae cyanobacterium MO_188.B28]
MVYDSSQNFPNNRSTLYSKALDILLEKWAAEKRIQRDDIYQGLHTDLEKALLAEIAYKEFEADRLFFKREKITQQITTFLEKILEAPPHLNSKAVLNAIEVQQGILVERAEDIYSFSHLTLQEFLTAQYIADDPDEIEKLVFNHLTDTHWREVFLLVAGLKRSADRLLLQMEKQAQSYLNTPKLWRLIQWADNATAESKGAYKPAAKRAAAVYLARARDLALFRDLALGSARVSDIALNIASDLARALDLALARDLALYIDRDRAFALALVHARDLDLDLAHQFNQVNIFKTVNFNALIGRLEALKTQIPDQNESKEVHHAFVDRLDNIWSDALRINPDLAKLSQKEANALQRYLEANRLIIQCKTAAVLVSRQVWEGIEERMLTVPQNN